ncbi:hypothetical protein B0J13DRAFT_426157, partial [Dactylonectria estremocensis]
LSYAGQPVFKYMRQVKADVEEIVTTFTKLHNPRVLHCDAGPRNVLYDVRNGRCMIVYLERAEVHTRQPLRPIS